MYRRPRRSSSAISETVPRTGTTVPNVAAKHDAATAIPAIKTDKRGTCINPPTYLKRSYLEGAVNPL
jgi:hypothetical protein